MKAWNRIPGHLILQVLMLALANYDCCQLILDDLNSMVTSLTTRNVNFNDLCSCRRRP